VSRERRRSEDVAGVVVWWNSGVGIECREGLVTGLCRSNAMRRRE
jgi:hypothetical protein